MLLLFQVTSCKGQNTESKQEGSDTAAYTYRPGSINGIGKWFMGREIAHVMGFQGMEWLNRPEREQEENVSLLLKNMNIQADDIIADIGAGSGYHVFKMATQAPEGMVYGVDIQEEMLAEMKRVQLINGITHVTLVKGSVQSVNLPENKVDKVLMVDVYHEFEFPLEMLASIKKAMKADAKLYLIEYRGEDPNIPIKTIHKMTEAQAVKELRAAGFTLVENIANLPWQHCMVFQKGS
ncbi:class I SAM-dependent methyltransferase [Leeuwenhoekiella parthenopeia]|uniref:Class I SAM-dependent methyltransferase n=1 Tax=Leeuwenhoekiella parthenopeia TaxID=2890320 RepID=A0ABS8GSL6_9FLAO|nr:class I SAM-dependent methyltransferase [Leeuwenhoekiella parthenopeia]MCC4212967.1 class I SAM-dependent methyltransferase [Leeuwenhoekiella parthenopeia]